MKCRLAQPGRAASMTATGLASAVGANERECVPRISTEGTATVLSQDRADCPGSKFPLQWRILPGGAAKIREGEMEHCEDLQYAYDVTFGWYAQVVDNPDRPGTYVRE